MTMISVEAVSEESHVESCERDDLTERALVCIAQGFAPPREVYLVQNRTHIDWSRFPTWARPVNPEMFDGCCHEG